MRGFSNHRVPSDRNVVPRQRGRWKCLGGQIGAYQNSSNRILIVEPCKALLLVWLDVL